MEFFTDDVMRGLLGKSLETAELGPDGFHDVGSGPGSPEAKYIDWLTIDDREQSVVDDVARMRASPGPRQHPYLRLHIRRLQRPARGGPEATRAGRAS